MLSLQQPPPLVRSETVPHVLPSPRAPTCAHTNACSTSWAQGSSSSSTTKATRKGNPFGQNGSVLPTQFVSRDARLTASQLPSTPKRLASSTGRRHTTPSLDTMTMPVATRSSGVTVKSMRAPRSGQEKPQHTAIQLEQRSLLQASTMRGKSRPLVISPPGLRCILPDDDPVHPAPRKTSPPRNTDKKITRARCRASFQDDQESVRTGEAHVLTGAKFVLGCLTPPTQEPCEDTVSASCVGLAPTVNIGGWMRVNCPPLTVGAGNPDRVARASRHCHTQQGRQRRGQNACRRRKRSSGAPVSIRLIPFGWLAIGKQHSIIGGKKLVQRDRPRCTLHFE